MRGHVISPRYAKVLFDLDCIKGNLDHRLDDFEAIFNIFDSNPKLVRFLKSPQVALKDKKEVFQDSLKAHFDQIFLNFLSYLIQKGRLVYLRSIRNEYKRLAGIWEADIVTAVPLDSESEAKLMEKLKQIFHKKIILKKRIDPTIIGGVILVVANEMLDWSVTGRLKKLKDNLIATQL